MTYSTADVLGMHEASENITKRKSEWLFSGNFKEKGEASKKKARKRFVCHHEIMKTVCLVLVSLF